MTEFIAAQRAEHDVPHASACRALAVSPAWFYKWRPPWVRPPAWLTVDEQHDCHPCTDRKDGGAQHPGAQTARERRA